MFGEDIESLKKYMSYLRKDFAGVDVVVLW